MKKILSILIVTLCMPMLSACSLENFNISNLIDTGRKAEETYKAVKPYVNTAGTAIKTGVKVYKKLKEIEETPAAYVDGLTIEQKKTYDLSTRTPDISL